MKYILLVFALPLTLGACKGGGGSSVSGDLTSAAVAAGTVGYFETSYGPGGDSYTPPPGNGSTEEDSFTGTGSSDEPGATGGGTQSLASLTGERDVVTNPEPASLLLLGAGALALARKRRKQQR
ncbi:MAG: PEP-CTERM sorting domain-containing protein [Candidatus Omnitrophica bacterium]|nr:PEP-CTERM sorting domain-containing protein [Candidatus Omnitrophota bacterium]